ncbi:MAG: amidohydrolase [Patescibacteria group bacterium]|nr:amidohydrolase [Patescibacteria group bacterium]
MSQVLDLVDLRVVELAKQLQQWFHKHAELGWQEEETMEHVTLVLNDGCQLNPRQLKGGIVCDIVNPDLPGTPMIGFRADLDALQIQEKTGLRCASRNPGVMHACGHDFHTGALLATATVLAANRHLLARNIRLLFTQAEEIPPGGEPELIRARGADGLTAVYGLHVITSAPEFGGVFPTGTFATRVGNITAHSDRVTIRLECEGGHAIEVRQKGSLTDAYSWWVDKLRAEILNPIPGALVHPAVPTASTQAPNILPSWLEFVVSFRAVDRENYEQAVCQLARIADLFRKVFPTTVLTIDHPTGHIPTFNDPAISLTATQAARDVLNWAARSNTVITPPRVWTDCPQIMGGESFGRFDHDFGIRSNYMMIGAGGITDDEQAIHGHGHHTPVFNPDERVLPLMLAYWLALAMQL